MNRDLVATMMGDLRRARARLHSARPGSTDFHNCYYRVIGLSSRLRSLAR